MEIKFTDKKQEEVLQETEKELFQVMKELENSNTLTNGDNDRLPHLISNHHRKGQLEEKWNSIQETGVRKCIPSQEDKETIISALKNVKGDPSKPFAFQFVSGGLKRPDINSDSKKAISKVLKRMIAKVIPRGEDFSGRVIVNAWNDPFLMQCQIEPKNRSVYR